jgi:hypothetical protein
MFLPLCCGVYDLCPDVCVCREPGSGAMGQPWTIHTGGLVSQVVALAGTACACTQIKLGMTTAVPAHIIMSVN